MRVPGEKRKCGSRELLGCLGREAGTWIHGISTMYHHTGGPQRNTGPDYWLFSLHCVLSRFYAVVYIPLLPGMLFILYVHVLIIKIGSHAAFPQGPLESPLSSCSSSLYSSLHLPSPQPRIWWHSTPGNK